MASLKIVFMPRLSHADPADSCSLASVITSISEIFMASNEMGCRICIVLCIRVTRARRAPHTLIQALAVDLSA